MKKGLLLSLVASTVLFAGGDIAPVEPVADAPAAACDAFSGSIGAEYNYDTTGTNTFDIEANLGVSKEIFGGLTLSLGLEGGMGYNIATSTRTVAVGGINELSLAYSYCNTAVKVGRFSTKGPLTLAADGTFEGAVIANTDIADTVLMAGYLYNNVTVGVVPVNKSANTVAAGFTNTSFADTTISFAGAYNLTTSAYNVGGKVDYKWSDTAISVGGGYASTTAYVVGATLTQNFGSSYIKVGGAYSSNMLVAFDVYDYGQAAADTYAVGAKLGTDWCGYGLYVDGNYQSSATWSAGAGISKTVSGIAFSVDVDYNSASVTSVAAKAVYKF